MGVMIQKIMINLRCKNNIKKSIIDNIRGPKIIFMIIYTHFKK